MEGTVWDKEKNHAIIYIDFCIDCKDVLSQIIAAVDIVDYVVEYVGYCCCKNAQVI